jgi:hypothetical protein
MVLLKNFGHTCIAIDWLCLDGFAHVDWPIYRPFFLVYILSNQHGICRGALAESLAINRIQINQSTIQNKMAKF